MSEDILAPYRKLKKVCLYLDNNLEIKEYTFLVFKETEKHFIMLYETNKEFQEMRIKDYLKKGKFPKGCTFHLDKDKLGKSFWGEKDIDGILGLSYKVYLNPDDDITAFVEEAKNSFKSHILKGIEKRNEMLEVLKNAG